MMMPYKIAVLCYICNSRGELLLLRRARKPNKDMYSPIGGKLEQAVGESPYRCALREIQEEIGVTLRLTEIALIGIVSETGHEGEAHWLMFCFQVNKPLDFPGRQIDEGILEWIAPGKLGQLEIPKTDRDVIWPLVMRHASILNGQRKGPGFFSVHIDCTDGEKFVVTPEVGGS
jgi:8-oxo-dGTP diphosphatase